MAALTLFVWACVCPMMRRSADSSDTFFAPLNLWNKTKVKYIKMTESHHLSRDLDILCWRAGDTRTSTPDKRAVIVPIAISAKPKKDTNVLVWRLVFEGEPKSLTPTPFPPFIRAESISMSRLAETDGAAVPMGKNMC
ncbi:ORF1342 [White spot syndrome virus]|nr:ORF1342 [White spot syndrome virus]